MYMWIWRESLRKITSKGIMYFIHHSGERMQLSTCTGLTTFLEFTLKVAEDVVKGNTTLPWDTHIGTHANETLLLDSRPACPPLPPASPPSAPSPPLRANAACEWGEVCFHPPPPICMLRPPVCTRPLPLVPLFALCT